MHTAQYGRLAYRICPRFLMPCVPAHPTNKHTHTVLTIIVSSVVVGGPPTTKRMITNIDDRIGMVMASLRACGADSNTVVIFTSDHGDLMGDHGIVLKGPLHYQGLIRVPIIWREPGATPADAVVREDLASSIDLGAAIIHRAGIAAPRSWPDTWAWTAAPSTATWTRKAKPSPRCCSRCAPSW